jgi:oxygen-independent coproporphyrinogen-3 oxidase
MGIQTFQPELLAFMNRAHNREEALRSFQLLSSTGFESFTVDLIYGNPHQDLDDLSKDLEILLGYEPPHISAYSLTIEPKTRLGKQVELGRIVPPEDDKVADHFKMINRRFQDANIERYEVSNYSQSGHEAIHNSSYWNHANYLGLGPGAHSFWWENEAHRWENKPDLRSYVADTGVVDEKEALSLTQLAEERLLMGLRTREGVGMKELSERYGYSFNDKQLNYLHMRQEEDKLTIDDRIVLSDKGILIADAIILDLVTLH